jgi:lipopolysaccharide/colanic/teichoic acid biosynthesis glycosyltransferase
MTTQMLEKDLARHARGAPKARYKRVLDLFITPPLLILTMPLFLVAALAIRIESAGPIFFRQDRVGYRGKIFRIFKFRTMTQSANADNDHLLEVLKCADPTKGQFKTGMDNKITKVGKILRKTSLDELPQLFNVVLGEMSLVGPRPHTLEEVALFPDKFACRHEIAPGLTGLWQVNGRNRLSAIEMLELDIEYVASYSLVLDLKILLATVPAVLRTDETE